MLHVHTKLFVSCVWIMFFKKKVTLHLRLLIISVSLSYDSYRVVKVTTFIMYTFLWKLFDFELPNLTIKERKIVTFFAVARTISAHQWNFNAYSHWREWHTHQFEQLLLLLLRFSIVKGKKSQELSIRFVLNGGLDCATTTMFLFSIVAACLISTSYSFLLSTNFENVVNCTLNWLVIQLRLIAS